MFHLRRWEGLERFRFKCVHIHKRRRSLCIRLGRPY
jgi:hypothetical protein